MNDFLLVILIAGLAAFLTYLGAPAAERYTVPHKVISAALQFASGIIAALVAFSLMPPAVRYGPYVGIVIAFFVGGALFVVIEYISANRQSSGSDAEGRPTSIGLYIGILVDLLVDGVVIGIGSTMTLGTGLLLALGLAASTVPLTFVTTATAKRQGVSRERRRLLAISFFLAILIGAMLGYVVLQNQALEVRLILIALASGFLITTVTQSMIPEANKEGEPSFAGILFIAGLSLYALLSLTLK
jgi:zinc transporter, ZIP family